MNIGKSIFWSVVLIGGGYYSYNYYKNNLSNARLSDSHDIDTTGMSNYTITFPYKYDKSIGDYYDAIKDIGYSYVDEKVLNDKNNKYPDTIVVFIKAFPKDKDKIESILSKLNKEIKVVDRT